MEVERFMQIKIKRSNLLLASFFVWELFAVISHSHAFEVFQFLPDIFRVVKIMCMTLCFLQITLRIIKKANIWLYFVIALGIGFLSYFYSTDDALLMLVLFTFALSTIDIELILKTAYFAIIFAVASVVFLCLSGVLPNDIFFADRGRAVTRYALGFYHPNTFAVFIAQLLLLFIYQHYDTLRLRHYLGIVLVTTVSYYLTFGRTSLFVLIGTLLFIGFSKLSAVTKLQKIWLFLSKTILKILIVAGVLGSVYLTISFITGHAVAQRVNDFVSGRITGLAWAWRMYPLKLFGQRVTIISSSIWGSMKDQGVVIDNSYIYYLLHFGLVPSILFFGSFFVMLRSRKGEKREAFFACAVGYVILGFMEKYFGMLEYNFVLLFFAHYIHMLSQNHGTSLPEACISSP